MRGCDQHRALQVFAAGLQSAPTVVVNVNRYPGCPVVAFKNSEAEQSFSIFPRQQSRCISLAMSRIASMVPARPTFVLSSFWRVRCQGSIADVVIAFPLVLFLVQTNGFLYRTQPLIHFLDRLTLSVSFWPCRVF